jgi:hypothetical protein
LRFTNAFEEDGYEIQLNGLFTCEQSNTVLLCVVMHINFSIGGRRPVSIIASDFLILARVPAERYSFKS